MLQCPLCTIHCMRRLGVRQFFRRMFFCSIVLAVVSSIVIMAQGKGNPEAAKVKNPVDATPAPDLTDEEWNHGSTDGEIFDVIKNGVPPELNMGPWRDRIKDPDLWNVVNFLRSIAKKK